MSAQAGIWTFDGQQPNIQALDGLAGSMRRYGPDGTRTFTAQSLVMVYCAFHTTKESRINSQPTVSASGTALMWDGRLDNRDELIQDLNPRLRLAGDAEIALAAYERWGSDSFRRLLGDWAITIWDPFQQMLILAKDFVGPRPLFYELTPNRLFWCSYLEPLILHAGHPFALDPIYLLGYVDSLPPAHLTPYCGVRSVPAGAFVQIKGACETIRTYWRFDSERSIRYRRDEEYEEHFRSVFRQAVARRLRSDTPVLSELSGGMDSSSIVCMADAIIREGCVDVQRLDTISYYDRSEPNSDEEPYFSIVEEKRGKKGLHLSADVGAACFFAPLEDTFFAALPGVGQSALEFERERDALRRTNQNRVVLSGIGGDEVAGGVPTAIPELADYLASGRFLTLCQRLASWSLPSRRPRVQLLLQTLCAFWPLAAVRLLTAKKRKIPPWFDDRLMKKNWGELRPINDYSLTGPRPSQQEFEATLAFLRRQLSCSPSPLLSCYEKRFPYLDRDLCEFLIAIPREQVVRPGQRRSLMRRALTGLVPEPILNRTKAFVSRRPLMVINEELEQLQKLITTTRHPLLNRFFSGEHLAAAVQRARHGHHQHLQALIRTIKLEMWCRSLCARGIALSDDAVGVRVRAACAPA